MKFEAYGQNILIEIEKTENVTSSGIVLQAKDEATQNKGIIRSKGQDVPEKLEIEARVLFRKYARSDYKDGEKQFAIVHADDILGIFHG